MVRLCLVILSVEIQRAGGQRPRVRLVVDVVVKTADRLLALVRYCDPGMALEGHGKKAVEAVLASHRKQLRLPGVVVSQAQSKEITNRCLHTGRGLPIPIDAQHYALQMGGLGASDRKPAV